VHFLEFAVLVCHVHVGVYVSLQHSTRACCHTFAMYYYLDILVNFAFFTLSNFKGWTWNVQIGQNMDSEPDLDWIICIIAHQIGMLHMSESDPPHPT